MPTSTTDIANFGLGASNQVKFSEQPDLDHKLSRNLRLRIKYYLAKLVFRGIKTRVLLIKKLASSKTNYSIQRKKGGLTLKMRPASKFWCTYSKYV